MGNERANRAKPDAASSAANAAFASGESEPLLVGIDTGGTFTDVVARVGETLGICKVLSTGDDPGRAFTRALATLPLSVSLSCELLPVVQRYLTRLQLLPDKTTFAALPGDVIRIETPGGGGFGSENGADGENR